jgi:signal transduction histidine kinase
MVDLLRASVARRTQLAFAAAGPVSPVLADATQIRQVILNLIVNAAEAIEQGNEAGRVTLTTGEEVLPRPHGATPVPAAPLPPGRYAYLDVSDTGAGMSPETAARMFDPFFTTKSTGRGLGLASVQGIVRQHRGALGVHSTPGHGTTIRVWFPVTP